MGNLKLADLRDLARGVGFPEESLDTAAAVAMAESRGNPLASNVVSQAQADAYNASHPTGPRHGPESSWGLWQVNTLAHPEYDATRLQDPDYNARAAFVISQGGLNWRAWSTYTAASTDPSSYLHWMPGGSQYDGA